MRIYTAELSGRALDIAAMMALGFTYQRGMPAAEQTVARQPVRKECLQGFWRGSPGLQQPDGHGTWACLSCIEDDRPSTDWAHGGPIIDTEGVMFEAGDFGGVRAYLRSKGTSGPTAQGRTHLVAAMRVVVLRKFGPVVEIPDGLLVTDI